jgi:hypothetical protein
MSLGIVSQSSVSHRGIDPVGKLPVELVVYIFKMICDPGFTGYQDAVRIMSVSQRWSNIATAIPALWSYVDCKLSDPLDKIQEFWTTMSSRAKNTPVSIFIDDVGTSDSGLQACRFDDFQTIETITLLLMSEDATDHLNSRQFHPPPTPFEHLELIVKASKIPLPWNANILTRFPPFVFLSVSGFEYPTIGQPFTNLSKLGIYMISLEVPFLGFFPGLTFLDIDVYDGGEESPPVVLPNLLILKAGRVDPWIKALSCQILHSLTVYRIAPDFRSTLSWLRLHHSIHCISVQHLDAPRELASAAPQLLRLSIDWPEKSDQHLINTLGSLLNLAELEVHDPHDQLTKAQFEEMVTVMTGDGRGSSGAANGVFSLRKLTIYSHVGDKRPWRSCVSFDKASWKSSIREGGEACVDKEDFIVVCERDVWSRE